MGLTREVPKVNMYMVGWADVDASGNTFSKTKGLIYGYPFDNFVKDGSRTFTYVNYGTLEQGDG